MERYKFLFETIRKGMFGMSVSQESEAHLSDEFLADVLFEAKRHDVGNVFSYCLDKLGMLNGRKALSAVCSEEQFFAVYRYENLNYEFERVCSILNENKISFVILKGAVIRDFYPEAYLRTSCDIDILVKSSEAEKAKDVIVEKLGYTFDEKTPHDYQLFSPNGVHLELHYSLMDSDILVHTNSVLEKVWENLEKLDKYEYGYKMNGDMFCYFHIVHLAKHIMTGGCGIRPILDLCFVEKNMKTTEKLHQFLEEGKMENAYSIATRLKDVWFFGKEHTNESRRFGSYVITGGVYGNLENVVTVKKMNRGNAFKYALSRIFIPYNKLIYRYPQLENRKYLLPYYEVKRWLDLLLGGRGKFAYNEFKANNALTRDKVDEIRQMKSDFGI